MTTTLSLQSYKAVWDLFTENVYYNDIMNIMNIQHQHLRLTPAAIFIFDETSNGLSEINILKGILGVGSCENNIMIKQKME